MRLNTKKQLAALIAVAGLAVPFQAFATNGYFSHGYGAKSFMMGGAGVAHPMDSIAAATNPAGMAHIGNRADLGAQLFNPNREYTHSSGAGDRVESGSDLFLVPHFGYNRMVNERTAVGVSVFGNGGMNTDYPRNNGVFGPAASELGIDLAQLMIAPTWARKLSDQHAIGASLVLAYQRFSAKGLNNFAVYSNSGGDLTNRGYDDSTGAGVRIGWMGQLSPAVSVGATYQSKIYMSKLDKYKGLFAEEGDFDIPANYAVGIAVKPRQGLTIAFDVERILYGDIKSIANPIANLFNCPALGGADSSQCLGGSNGAGFGWEDRTYYKLGVEYQRNSQWTFRGGLNYGSIPYDNTEIDFNIIAPAVVTTHLTLGFTYSPDANREWDVGYMHAFEKKYSGTSSFGLGAVTHQMDQNALYVSYAWKLK